MRAWILACTLAVAATTVGSAQAETGSEAVVEAKAPDSVQDPLSVTTRLTPEGEHHIGDLLTLEVLVAHPQGYTVNLPMGLDFAPLELVETIEGGTESTGQALRTTFTLRLQHFAVGEASIPAFRVTYVGPGGEVQTFTVPAKSFEVAALTANESEPERRGEDPMLSFEYPNTRIELIVYSCLAMALLLPLLWWLFRYLRRREKAVVVVPPRPPDEVALAALRDLEAQRDRMIEAGEFQPYYLELTEIAKGYLQGRFAIDVLDRTTQEIREDLARAERKLEGLDSQRVVQFLEDCDMVKFARFSPPKTEARGALQEVRSMVTDTSKKTTKAAKEETSA